MIPSSTASSARRGACSLALAIAAIAPASAARAEASAADRAAAESLFDQGRTAMQVGRYAEACPLLAKSQELDPGGGTLLNLAICHEQEGRTATAWVEFREAAAMAARDRRDDREQLARAHVTSLDAVLSRLTVAVSVDTAPPGLEVLRDGAPVSRAAWNAPIPVDPGQHTITARAPGRAPFTHVVTIGLRSDAQRVIVPDLAASGPTAATTPPAAAAPPSPPAARFQRTVGFVLGGVGLATLGVAVGVGAYALARDSAARVLCGGVTSCPAGEGLDTSRGAHRAAQATDLLLCVGAATLVTGVAVVLTAKPSAKAATVGVGPGTLTLGGRF